MLLHPHNLLGLGTIAVAAWAGWLDHRHGLIPNRLVAIAALALVLARALFAAVLRGPGQIGTALLVSLLGALAAGLVPLAMYSVRSLGGGDVKLLGCCGIGLGPVIGLEAELYAFGLGALYACGRAAWHGTLWETLRGSSVLVTNPLLPRRMQQPVPASALTPIRFGPAIACGVAFAVAMHWGPP